MKNYKEKYGQWALVTGASSGIGEEFTKRLAENGMNIILIARREERLKDISDEIEKKYEVKTLVVPVDLSKENFLPELIDAVGDREVGMLINNAGYGSTGEFVNNDPEFEINMVRVNCLAPTILTHHFVRPMKERKKGAVIFLGSVVAYQPTPLMTAYSATKVFNKYMGEGLWYELRKFNIDVLSLNPGGTDTEFQRIATTTSGPFTRTPEEVVETALNSLGSKMSVVDGFPNKLMTFFGRFIPDKILVSFAGKIADDMHKKNNS